MLKARDEIKHKVLSSNVTIDNVTIHLFEFDFTPKAMSFGKAGCFKIINL
jgi:hypothetical protein